MRILNKHFLKQKKSVPLSSRILPFFHRSPIHEAVGIHCKKSDEANDHRQILYVLRARHAPHYNQHYVVETVADRIEAASSCREVCREELSENRNRAY